LTNGADPVPSLGSNDECNRWAVQCQYQQWSCVEEGVQGGGCRTVNDAALGKDDEGKAHTPQGGGGPGPFLTPPGGPASRLKKRLLAGGESATGAPPPPPPIPIDH